MSTETKAVEDFKEAKEIEAKEMASSETGGVVETRGQYQVEEAMYAKKKILIPIDLAGGIGYVPVVNGATIEEMFACEQVANSVLTSVKILTHVY